MHFISGRAVILDRDLRDSTGDRWYWHGHVRLAADQDAEVRVCLARPNLLGRFGPAVRSTDEYVWLWHEPRDADDFHPQIEAGSSVYACATIPYGPRELAAFRARHAEVRWDGLSTSEAGRVVPVLTVPARGSRRVILPTGRHHACEAMSSFVLEGAVEEFAVLAREGDEAARAVALVAVPMMDVDGVHAGDQGKARRPWDHSRDYGPDSRYRSVSALRAMMTAEGRDVYAVDLHTPGLRGEIEERPHVVASGDAGDTEVATELLSRLNATDPSSARGGSWLLPFHDEWNSAVSAGRRCCAAWLRHRPRTRLATTIEYPNAVDRGRPITRSDARVALLRALLTMVE